jgi:hypothetical protein
MFNSAQQRFVEPELINFFQKAFPMVFGKLIAQKLAQSTIELLDKLRPERESLEVGQVLWNALHKNTRGDSPNRQFVPVVLTVVSKQDAHRLANGENHARIAEEAIARMIREAYKQDGILSMRDIALLTLKTVPSVTKLRQNYEKVNDVVLPHTGVLHDMGSCITHKKQIVFKVIVEKKDPTIVALETNHSQKAVDNYLQNYNRVKTAFLANNDINYIHIVTNISKNVIKQYLLLYNEFEAQA